MTMTATPSPGNSGWIGWLRTGSVHKKYLGGIEAEIQKIERNNVVCAVVQSDDKVIVDAQSSLDTLIGSGLAGEILQKYVNYGGRIAIYGDFSQYTGKPLKDFIYESNKGHDVFFASTEEEAIQMITRWQFA